jgi:putative spermidine/putrescine transport system ATP-binding protein
MSVEGQEVHGPKPITEAGEGGTVTLALRPESLELGEDGGANRFRGSVEDVAFLGSIVRVRMGIGGDAVVSFDTFNDPSQAAPEVGSTVTVSFPPEACLVVGAGTAPEIDIVAEG